METVAIDDLEPSVPSAGLRRWGLTDPLDATHLAINRYRVAPGASLPGGLHAHMDQEEVFVVLAGEATFLTLEGEVVVAAGEAVRFPPGEFQSGENRADDPLSVLAIGAPRETTDTRIPVACPDCAHDDLRIEAGAGGPSFVCPGCDLEHVPSPCPTCGGDDLRVRPGEETRTVVRCRGCGTEFERPPGVG